LIELLVLAVAPGLFFTWFFYVRDKYEKEPKSLIIVTFILGMLSIVPALFLSLFLGVIFPDVGGFFQILLHYLVVVALVEEVAKFSAVLRAYQSSEFDEIMDGMVYSATAALGFATVENVFYVLSGGLQTGILRAILSVPGHGLNGSMMGYYLGRAKLNEGRRVRLLLVLRIRNRSIQLFSLFYVKGYLKTAPIVGTQSDTSPSVIGRTVMPARDICLIGSVPSVAKISNRSCRGGRYFSVLDVGKIFNNTFRLGSKISGSYDWANILHPECL
jgi:hypothetical protein